jgi:metal-responsive CopG/Arc/MetJ family transcriptional regulator
MVDEKDVIRITISFPKALHHIMDNHAKKQYRSINSLVLEACDHYLQQKLGDNSPEYLAFVGQLKKDLGLQ